MEKALWKEKYRKKNTTVERAVPDFERLAGKNAVATLLLTEDQFKHGNYREDLEDFFWNSL